MSDTFNFNLSSFTLADAVLPYFGGTVGKACRLAAVANWEKENTTLNQQLDEVMKTDLYKKAKSYCQSQIDDYNNAAGDENLCFSQSLETLL